MARAGGSARPEAALEELAAIDRALTAMKVSEDAAARPTIVRGWSITPGCVRAELLLDTTDDKGRACALVRSAAAAVMMIWSPLHWRAPAGHGLLVRVSRLASALKAAGRGAADPCAAGRGHRLLGRRLQHYLDAVSELRNAGSRPSSISDGRA